MARISPLTFGRMCRDTTWMPDPPSDRDRSTNNRSLTVSTCARTRRRGRRPRRHADDEDDVPHRPAQHRGQDDREGEERDHEEPLGEPHEHAVPPAAEEAGEDPDDRTERDRERRGSQADEQADPAAPDELRPDGAAQVVGAEGRVLRWRGPLRHAVGAGGGGVEPGAAGDEWSEQRHDHEREQHEDADPTWVRAPELPRHVPHRAPTTSPARGGCDRGDCVRHVGRTRGSRTAYNRSANRLNTITAALNTRNRPCSIGRSGPRIASEVALPSPGHE